MSDELNWRYDVSKEFPVWEGHICPVCYKPVCINHIQENVYILGCYNQECVVKPFGFGMTMQAAEVEYESKATDISMLIFAIREGKYSV